MSHRPRPPTSIVYCRVSSQEQTAGTSLESQQRLCEVFARRQGWLILRVFVEAGESAKTADRPELNKAIAFCKQKRVGFFVVYKIDRFARNQDDHVTVRAVLRRANTELRSVTEPIDDTPIGRAMEGMLSVFAELDNNVRTERTKQGMLERVKEGIWVWPTPLGYSRARGNLVPDPEKAAFIKLAYELFAGGSYTYRALGSLLAARGFRTRQGKQPSTQNLHRILHNPVYCGLIRVWGSSYPGAFRPLVSRELFEACQPAFRKDPVPRRVQNPDYPLRGFVICSACQRPFTGSAPRGERGGRYAYYHHATRRACHLSRAIPTSTLERQFIELLKSLEFAGKYERLLLGCVKEHWQTFIEHEESQQAAKKRDISRLEHERQEVFRLHRRHVYTDQQFHEQLQSLDKAIAELAAALPRTMISQDQLVARLGTELQRLTQPAHTWQELAIFPDRRLDFQRRIFKKPLLFDGERFGTPDLSVVYSLLQQSSGEKSQLVALLQQNWNLLLDEFSYTWDDPQTPSLYEPDEHDLPGLGFQRADLAA